MIYSRIAKSLGYNARNYSKVLKNTKFDTYAFVSLLKENGFTDTQAIVMMDSLDGIISKNAQDLKNDIKSELVIDEQLRNVSVNIEELRTKLEIVEKTKFLLLKYEVDKLQTDHKNLVSLFKDENDKLKSGVKLDISLEKGRNREEVGQLSQLIKDNKTYIETETERLRTLIETSKLDFYKSMFGALMAAASLTFAYIRLIS